MTLGFTMKKLAIVLATLALIGYVALGVNTLVSKQHKLELNEIKLKSTSSELQDLQLQYNQLNSSLDKELHKNTTDEQKVKQLESEKQDLQKKSEQLESQLQAKLQAKQQAAELASRAINTLTGTATASAAGADKYALMAQAGIAPGDYEAVDYIVMHEGHYDPCVINGGAVDCSYAVNGGQKAYGVCQALPGSKMASAGADWATNPVTQLRWCASYAGNYGGWWGAYNFWINNRWW